MINEGLAEEWPEDVLAAVAAFQQGDLVERPPFFYVGGAKHGIWGLTREHGDPEVPDELFEVHPDFCPPYGLITTETCDLTEEDGRPRHPWFSVAPVYDASLMLDDNQRQLLDEGRMAYLRRVQSDMLPDGVWVVDARIEMPIEKSWLVGRRPIRSCADETASQMLAGFLAGRRDRPILAKALYIELITPMRRWIERMPAPKRDIAMEGVSEVRLTVAGSLVDPDGVGLIVVSEREPISKPMTDAWDSRWETWRSRLESREISLLGNAYKTYDTLTAREYRDSLQIPLGLAA